MHQYVKTFLALIIFLVLIGCNTVTPTLLPTTEPLDQTQNKPAPVIESTTMPTATATVEVLTGYGLPSVSAILYGDAGNYDLQAGVLAQVTWPEAPPAADSYSFTLKLHTDKSLLLIGTDTDASDGVSVEWLIPENISGELSVTAYFAGGREVRSFAIDVYADKAVPAGTCVVRAHTTAPLSVYQEPSDTTEIIGVMYPTSMVEVVGKNSNGWYKIKTDEVYTVGSSEQKIGPGTAWLSETSTLLFGACENLPNE
jgi:hypothetical protein